MLKGIKMNKSALLVVLVVISLTVSLMGCQSEPTAQEGPKYIDRALTPEQFEAKLAEGNAIVVDIRRAEELEEKGKYKDSIHVPNELIQENQDEAIKLLPENKDTTLLIHCAVGGRASKAIDIVIDKLGYKNAYYLASPIVFDAEGNIKDYVVRALNPEQFEAKLKEEGVVVVDIRREDELQEKGKYKDSIHVPNELINEDLEAAAKLLPVDKNTTLLIHCAKGGRASSAIEKVAYDLGYKNAYYLNNTIFFDTEGNITGYTAEDAQGAGTTGDTTQDSGTGDGD